MEVGPEEAKEKHNLGKNKETKANSKTGLDGNGVETTKMRLSRNITKPKTSNDKKGVGANTEPAVTQTRPRQEKTMDSNKQRNSKKERST